MEGAARQAASLSGQRLIARHGLSKQPHSNKGNSGDRMKWYGVMPAMTTCFNQDLTVDHGFMSTHARWMIENGCSGLVSLGSLGEGATLTVEEKIAILKNMRKSLPAETPLVAAISSLSTQEAVEL